MSISRRTALATAAAAVTGAVVAPLAMKAAGVKAALAVEPLLGMERRMNTVETILDGPGGFDSRSSVFREWTSIQDQIAVLPAISVAGIAVKLRLMRANTEYLDCHEFGDKLIASTIESAERLAKEARS